MNVNREFWALLNPSQIIVEVFASRAKVEDFVEKCVDPISVGWFWYNCAKPPCQINGHPCFGCSSGYNISNCPQVRDYEYEVIDGMYVCMCCEAHGNSVENVYHDHDCLGRHKDKIEEIGRMASNLAIAMAEYDMNAELTNTLYELSNDIFWHGV